MIGRHHLGFLIGAALFSNLAAPPAAHAQQPNAQPRAPQAQPPALPMPDAFKLNMLIRNVIIALNQANMTGNYTVLRDLSAPGFQHANNAARLAQIFAHLRERNLDLSPVFFINPTLVREPAIDGNGLLRMTGFFPSQPEQVQFDMAFQFFDNQWRLFGIAVNVAPMAAQVSNADPVKPAAKETKALDQKRKSASPAGGRGSFVNTAPNPPKKTDQAKAQPAPSPAALKPQESPKGSDESPKTEATAALPNPATSGWAGYSVRIDLSDKQ